MTRLPHSFSFLPELPRWCWPGWPLKSSARGRCAVRFGEVPGLLTIANRPGVSEPDRLAAARKLCSHRYLLTHRLAVAGADDGGLVGLPRNFDKNFKASRRGRMYGSVRPTATTPSVPFISSCSKIASGDSTARSPSSGPGARSCEPPTFRTRRDHEPEPAPLAPKKRRRRPRACCGPVCYYRARTILTRRASEGSPA